MKHPCIVIRYKGKPIYIAQIEELESKEIFALQRECEKNKKEIVDELSRWGNIVDESIDKLEKDVKHLKGED